MHTDMDLLLAQIASTPEIVRRKIWSYFLAVRSKQHEDNFQGEPAGPRGDPTIPPTNGRQLLVVQDRDDNRPGMNQVLDRIYSYLLPRSRFIPASWTFTSAAQVSIERHESRMGDLLLISRAIMADLAYCLYEKTTFEVRVTHDTITFLNQTKGHIRPIEALFPRGDSFGVNRVFGFARVQHLKLVIETMFPGLQDPCRDATSSYDLDMYSSLRGMVSLLCDAPWLKEHQCGLKTLEVVFSTTHTSLYTDDGAEIPLDPPTPRRPFIHGSSGWDWALDFVTRPLTALRGLDSANFTFPEFLEQGYPERDDLMAWGNSTASEMMKDDPSGRKRVDFEEFVYGEIRLEMLEDAKEEREHQEAMERFRGPSSR